MYDAAVVGCGVIGRRLADAFAEHDRTALVAACDLDADAAAALADEYGATAYTDHDAMLAEASPDLVHVGVPPVAHFEVVDAALSAGAHVVCEKPIAPTAAEGRELVARAAESDHVTAINFPFRYTPGVRELVDRVAAGAVGDPRRLSLRFRFPQWPRPWQDVGWLEGREQGGPTREVGSHFLFGALELFDDVAVVDATREFGGPEACETSVLARLEADGVAGSFDLLADCAGEEENSLTVEGTEGALALADWRTLVADPGTDDERVVTEADGETTLTLVDEVVAAMDGADADLVDFETALAVQELVDDLLGIGA